MLLTVLFVPKVRFYTKQLVLHSVLLRCVGLFFLYCLFSAAFNSLENSSEDNPEKLSTLLFDGLLVLGLICLVSYCRQVEQGFMRHLCWLFLPLIVAVLVIALHQYFDDRHNPLWPRLADSWLLPLRCQVLITPGNCAMLPDYYRLRGAGHLYNPNQLAFVLGFSLVAASILIGWCSNGWYRLGLYLCCLVIAYVIFLTGSLGVWLGLLMAGFCYITRRWYKTLCALLLLLMLASPVVGLLASMDYLIDWHLLPRGSSYRDLIWGSVFAGITGVELLLGQGLDPLPLTSIGLANTPVHHHSVFVSTLFSFGLIGLSLLMLLFYQLMIAAAQVRLLPMIAYAIVIFTFDGPALIDKNNLYWLIIWLPLALSIPEVYADKRLSFYGLPKIEAA
ncbi:MAG: hypothetical protein KUG79_05605 [Pseudomonadales bacterium]|nr:hypothetical protein [Pseudomonadales bacterium]